jgi:catechol 2,3-dioxygenase-like lactoylglutathione lyase family enzyme
LVAAAGREGTEALVIEINGVAHVILSVSEWDRCRAFYGALLPYLGLTRVFEGEDFIYYVGGRTAVGINRCDAAHAGQHFVQGSVGLHHVCFRCRTREDVDRAHSFLKTQDATIVRAPQEGSWAPGYYSVLFEDPAGIRLEFNYVPGKGVLAEGVRFTPTGYR